MKYEWQKRQERYFENRNKENGVFVFLGMILMSVVYILAYFLACFW